MTVRAGASNRSGNAIAPSLKWQASVNCTGRTHWFMEAAHFVPSFRHSQFISRVKDDIGHDSARAAMRQTFIKHYDDKYGEPELPRS